MALTDTEKKEASKKAHKAIHGCKTIAELVPVWNEHMLILGHKAVARLLVNSVNPDGTKKVATPTG